MFNEDFSELVRISRISLPLDDKESKLLNMKDFYNTPLLFGDSVIFMHTKCNTYRRKQELSFHDFVMMIHNIRMQRTEYIKMILGAYNDSYMLSDRNIQRANNDFHLDGSHRNHIIVKPR